jgi:hypothetical protein
MRGDSINYEVSNADGTPVRTPEEREAFVKEQLANLEKHFADSPDILAEIRSR